MTKLKDITQLILIKNPNLTNLKTPIRTEATDINGNIFFTGLPNGTYTVEIVNQTGWIQSNPASGSTSVTVSNNSVEILDFYNCTN